jgi:hypothetical protein
MGDATLIDNRQSRVDYWMELAGRPGTTKRERDATARGIRLPFRRLRLP